MRKDKLWIARFTLAIPVIASSEKEALEIGERSLALDDGPAESSEVKQIEYHSAIPEEFRDAVPWSRDEDSDDMRTCSEIIRGKRKL